jgi:hypothetical protein
VVLSVDPVTGGGKRGRTVGERCPGRLGSVRIARDTTGAMPVNLPEPDLVRKQMICLGPGSRVGRLIPAKKFAHHLDKLKW